MKIAKLNKRIDILAPELTKDGYGGYNTNFVKVKSVWAEVVSSKYSPKAAYDAPMVEEGIKLRIRYYDKVKKGWRILMQGQEYEIISVERLYSDSVFLEITEYEAGV